MSSSEETGFPTAVSLCRVADTMVCGEVLQPWLWHLPFLRIAATLCILELQRFRVAASCCPIILLGPVGQICLGVIFESPPLQPFQYFYNSYKKARGSICHPVSPEFAPWTTGCNKKTILITHKAIRHVATIFQASFIACQFPLYTFTH